MKQKSILIGLIAILSAIMILSPTLIDDVSALKSTGNPAHKYGYTTKHIVCGGTLCSDADSIKVKEKTIRIEGLNVFYLEAGSSDAPTVLLLHGFPTSSHMFRNLVPKLADEFHVIAPDYIGYGKSSMPTVNEFEYSFARQTQIIEQLVEKLKLDSYTIYVMDYGGPVGFRLFDNHPEKVKGFVIQNANAYDEGLGEFWDDWKVWWDNPTPENESKLHYLVAPETTKWQYTFGTRNPDAIDPTTWTTDQVGLDRPGNVAIQLAMAYDYRTNIPLYQKWQESFRKYQPPVLIVWGGNDYIFPEIGAHQYERDLKHVEKYILDTGHFVLEEDLDFVAKHMREFVRSVQ